MPCDDNMAVEAIDNRAGFGQNVAPYVRPVGAVALGPVEVIRHRVKKSDQPASRAMIFFLFMDL